MTLDQVETLNGTYAVTVADGVVSIGGATVIATDLMAGNGVVHLIDPVILSEYLLSFCALGLFVPFDWGSASGKAFTN